MKIFCGDCGTGICNKVSFGPFNFTVAAGIIDENAGLPSQMHCQMKDKKPWYDISADGKPNFDGFPDANSVS